MSKENKKLIELLKAMEKAIKAYTYIKLKQYRLQSQFMNDGGEDFIQKSYLYVIKNRRRLVQTNITDAKFALEDHPNLIAYVKMKINSEMLDYIKSSKYREEVQIALVTDAEGNKTEYDFSDSQGLYASDNSEDRMLDKYDLDKGMQKIDEMCRKLLTYSSTGYSFEDISIKMEITIGTVGSRLNRCTKKLRDLLIQ
tara:strand:- start:1210 stop:1800 length:591 start_codon:yes stop_codon:yes gene_type:complete